MHAVLLLYRDYVHAVLLLYRDYVHAMLLLYRDYVHAVLLLYRVGTEFSLYRCCKGLRARCAAIV